MNNCSFIGRVGRDAETRKAGDSQATSFPIAVDSGYGDKKTTFWIDCTVWGDRGAKIASYIRKGDNIGVFGEIGIRQYTAKDGDVKTTATLRVAEVKLLAPKNDSRPAPSRAPPQRSAPKPSSIAATSRDHLDDDEIPFN